MTNVHQTAEAAGHGEGRDNHSLFSLTEQRGLPPSFGLAHMKVFLTGLYLRKAGRIGLGNSNQCLTVFLANPA